MLQGEARDKTVGKKNRSECCPDVLAAIGLDEEDGGDIVGDHHHPYHREGQELKVAGEQGKDKSTEQNVKNIEEDSLDHLTIRCPH